MIFNRAVHLKAVKGHRLLQALYQLMTELHFPLISPVIPLLPLQPNLWLKYLAFPDQHLNAKANRTTWQNWPYVIISPKWSLMSIEAFKGGASSWWAQSHKPEFRHGNLQGENKVQTQTRMSVQLIRESKSQGKKAPPILRSQVQAQEKSSSTKESEEQFHQKAKRISCTTPWELETPKQAGTALQSTLALGPDNSLHLGLTHRELQEVPSWAVPLPQTS